MVEKLDFSLSKQILGVKNNTSIGTVLVELGRILFTINIETQLFKYLQRMPFVKEDCYLRQAFNEELVNIKSG